MFGNIFAQTVEVAVYRDIFCNKCGRSCQTVHGGPEFANLTADWGYGSSKDGDRHQAHVCELCYDEFVKSFALPVRVGQTTLIDPLSEHEVRNRKHDHASFIVVESPDD